MKQFILGFFLALAFLGCSTTPKKVVVPEKQKIKQDNQIGIQLSEKFENQLRIRENLEASIYLRSLAESLVKNDSVLKESPIGVFLHLDRSAEPFRNYGLAGNRVYLSIGLIQTLAYESELAATLAVELAHIKKRHAIARLEKDSSKDTIEGGDLFSSMNAPIFLGPGGVFAFTLDENLDAVDEAVAILYSAGIDARGLISMLSRYESNKARSPYDSHALEMLSARAREDYSFYAPLRNPNVGSSEFTKFKKRISKL